MYYFTVLKVLHNYHSQKFCNYVFREEFLFICNHILSDPQVGNSSANVNQMVLSDKANESAHVVSVGKENGTMSDVGKENETGHAMDVEQLIPQELKDLIEVNMLGTWQGAYEHARGTLLPRLEKEVKIVDTQLEGHKRKRVELELELSKLNKTIDSFEKSQVVRHKQNVLLRDPRYAIFCHIKKYLPRLAKIDPNQDLLTPPSLSDLETEPI